MIPPMKKGGGRFESRKCSRCKVAYFAIAIAIGYAVLRDGLVPVILGGA